MGRTVRELDRSLSSEELTEWIAYYELEPFGAWRDNIHAGIVASMIANVHRRKNTTALTADDFMLRDEDERRKKKTADMVSWMRSVAVKKDG